MTQQAEIEKQNEESSVEGICSLCIYFFKDLISNNLRIFLPINVYYNNDTKSKLLLRKKNPLAYYNFCI